MLKSIFNIFFTFCRTRINSRILRNTVRCFFLGNPSFSFISAIQQVFIVVLCFSFTYSCISLYVAIFYFSNFLSINLSSFLCFHFLIAFPSTNIELFQFLLVGRVDEYNQYIKEYLKFLIKDD